MGIGPSPGTTYKTRCTAKSSHTASFNGDISIAISGTKEQIEYYEFGRTYIWNVMPADGDKPDGGDTQASTS